MAGVRLVFTKAFMVTVLLTLLLNVGVKPAAGQFSACNINDRPHPRGVCGSTLADLREYACTNLNQPAKVKRNAETDQDDPLRNIRLSSESALTYLTKRHVTTNIVCECCIKSCTFSELIHYCS